MSRVLNAVHLPNVPGEDLGRLAQAVPPTGGAVTLDQDWPRWASLARRAPTTLVVWRLWNENDPYRFDPVARAEETVRRLGPLIDDPFLAVQATNECDIEPRRVLSWPVGQRLDALVDWESRFWEAFDKAAPGRRCLSCSPNLSFGHDWREGVPDSEYQHPGLAGLIARHVDTGGLIGLHVYGAKGGTPADLFDYFDRRPFRRPGTASRHDPGGVAAQIGRPDARFVVTEWGTWLHNRDDAVSWNLTRYREFCRMAQTDGRFLFVAPFIWDTDAAHPENRMGGAFRRGLAELEPITTRATVPTARPGFGSVAPKPDPGPWTPRPIPEDAPIPRPSDFPFPAAVPEPGDGWAAFAGRIAGHPRAPYRIRLAWAEHVLAANGLARAADGTWPDLHAQVDGAPRVYRVPREWLRVIGYGGRA